MSLLLISICWVLLYYLFAMSHALFEFYNTHVAIQHVSVIFSCKSDHNKSKCRITEAYSGMIRKTWSILVMKFMRYFSTLCSGTFVLGQLSWGKRDQYTCIEFMKNPAIQQSWPVKACSFLYAQVHLAWDFWMHQAYNKGSDHNAYLYSLIRAFLSTHHMRFSHDTACLVKTVASYVWRSKWMIIVWEKIITCKQSEQNIHGRV